MTVESNIYDLLKGLVGGRVFPDVAAFDTPRPYITYQQIGGAVLSPLGREVLSKKNGRFQIDVWADTRASAASLALQIESAFITATAFQSSPVSAPLSRYEPDFSLYGSSQDFSIWSDR